MKNYFPLSITSSLSDDPLIRYGKRKIIHIDMDCFFAAVEMRDNPELKHKPLGIGGRPGSRSVLCTANYEARKYGVHSAMSSTLAAKLCPHLIIIRPNTHKYKEASQKVKKIFEDYTSIIEPLSIDEAYLDVTDSKVLGGSATLISRHIRQRIESELGLTASAGIAPNKFLAKVGSEFNKPNGQKVITPQDVTSFIEKLPVASIPGVGKVTLQKMKNLNIEICQDLQNKNIHWMERHFGKFGQTLWERCFGLDNRPVGQSFDRKSMSVEETYPHDISELEEAIARLDDLQQELSRRLLYWKKKYSHDDKKASFDPGTPQGLVIKIKTCNFNNYTAEQKLPIDELWPLWETGQWGPSLSKYLINQLKVVWTRANAPIRLLGVGIRLKPKADNKTPYQLDLFWDLPFKPLSIERFSA